MDLSGTLYTASTWIIPILVAITFHEAAHAYAAWKLGDETAFRLGRVTFNPLKHVDPFGTILLPALLFLTKAPFLFGWAKPVPVAFRHLRLLSNVWGLNFDPNTKVVDVYIRYLRQKIEEDGEPPLIKTVRGFGYTLVKETGDSSSGA